MTTGPENLIAAFQHISLTSLKNKEFSFFMSEIAAVSLFVNPTDTETSDTFWGLFFL